MKKHILFIQGAGEGAYEEDRKLADSLQDALGVEYHVLFPKMPNEESPEDDAWIAQIANELALLDGQVILVGHSAGGAVLLKYLLKTNLSVDIVGRLPWSVIWIHSPAACHEIIEIRAACGAGK